MSKHKIEKEPIFLGITLSSDIYKQLESFKERWQGVEIQEVCIRVEVGHGKAKEAIMTLTEFLTGVGQETAAKNIRPVPLAEYASSLNEPGESK